MREEREDRGATSHNQHLKSPDTSKNGDKEINISLTVTEATRRARGA
jgi:hypothetical protein